MSASRPPSRTSAGAGSIRPARFAAIFAICFLTATGVLMTLAQDFQDQQLQLLKQKREKRHPKQATAPPPAGKQS